MKRVDVEAIRSRLAAATPGPWECGQTVLCEGDGCKHCWHTFDAQADVVPPLGECGPVAVACMLEHNNGSLIAHARTDLELLCDEVERLRSENENLRERLTTTPDAGEVHESIADR